jgi:hypothetical protein
MDIPNESATAMRQKESLLEYPQLLRKVLVAARSVGAAQRAVISAQRRVLSAQRHLYKANKRPLIETKELHEAEIGLLLLVLGLRGDKLEPEPMRIFSTMLARWARKYGVCISPSYSMRKYFLRRPNMSLARRLDDDADSVHRELLELLAKWSKPQTLHVPPILSIVLRRASSTADILPALVSVRSEFGGLRRSMQEMSAVLSSDLNLRRKLKIVQSLDSARETILKGATSKGGKTIIQRSWDIVKKGSLWEMFTGLADLALEWDADRQLIGGVRHFVHLERLALDAKASAKDIQRIFGELRAK